MPKPPYILHKKKIMKYCNANYLFECQSTWYIYTYAQC